MSIASPLRSLRVFLVEDHEDTRRFMTLILRRMGHEVTIASNMGEAVRKLGEASYDVLLSDIGLPDGDGWTLMKILHNKQPPFAIAMSGYGTDADVARSLSAGFRHHMVKPFKAEKLKSMLAEASTYTACKEDQPDSAKEPAQTQAQQP